jgi:phage baseplate assembly protein W
MIKSLYKKFFLIIFMLASLANCVHKGSVEAVRPTNIYSDTDKKIQGNFVYVVDKTSLSKLKRDDTVQGFLCGAHNYPVDGTEAFNSSLPHMLEQVFEKITRVNEGSAKPNTVQLLFRVERFEPRLRFSQKFFGADADGNVELSVSVTGTKDGARIFGTTVDTQRNKHGDGGPFCAEGTQVLADGVRDSIKDVLEKLGERMANSQSLRKH